MGHLPGAGGERHITRVMDKLAFTTILIVSTMTYSVWSLQCYNCGYRKVNGGEAEELPEMTYCNDFAKPTDIVVNCTQPGDCCASMKEEIDRLDANGNKNYTELIAKHGCGSDIGNIEGRHHYCSEHPDSCFNEEDPIFPEPTPGGGASATVASIALVSLGALIIG